MMMDVMTMAIMIKIMMTMPYDYDGDSYSLYIFWVIISVVVYAVWWILSTLWVYRSVDLIVIILLIFLGYKKRSRIAATFRSIGKAVASWWNN